MNINKYIKTFGHKTFHEMPFNEVDGLIFAEMAYINFNLVIPDNHLVKLKDIKIENKKEFYYGSVDARYNRVMIESMMKSKRYENIKIGYCIRKDDYINFQQFFAMTIIMPTHEAYIAYRGTDVSLLGWREDFYIAFQDVFPSQLMALEYVNNVTQLFHEKFYIGGHSKGGNLAIFAAVYMDPMLQSRLLKAFSYDGPGFRQEINKLNSFKQIEDRIVKFLTSNDVIGVVYNKFKDVKIVYSRGILLGGHDPFTWSVKNGGNFYFTKERSKQSKKSEEAMMNWLTNLKDEQKQLAIAVLFDFIGESKTIYDLLLNGARILFNGKKRLSNYPPEQINEAKDIFKQLGRYYLDAFNIRRINKKKPVEEPKRIAQKTEKKKK